MSTGRNKYEASASATGYLYQCRYALYAGVRAIPDNPNLEISIERFDDVAFEQAGEPVKLIQVKHHVARKGNLTDASTDLWKTLRIWAERLTADLEASVKTSFVLMTTGVAPAGSAASYLRARDRDEANALDLLVKVTDMSTSETNKAAYTAFLDLLPEARLNLLRALTVLDGSSNVIDVRDDLTHELRYAVSKDYLSLFMERLEGWWFNVVVRALMGIGVASIPLTAIENKMDDRKQDGRSSRRVQARRAADRLR